MVKNISVIQRRPQADVGISSTVIQRSTKCDVGIQNPKGSEAQSGLKLDPYVGLRPPLDDEQRGWIPAFAGVTARAAFKLSWVKKLFLFITILYSTASFAAEFSASVDHSELALNHSLVLTLKLSDATAKSAPEFAKIKELFNIVATSQSSSVAIINTKSSTLAEWNLTLRPKKEGNIIIPAITVETNNGKLTTKALEVKIVAAEPIASTDKNSGIFVEKLVDNKKPYKFEPFIYTIKLYTKHEVRDVIFEPLELPELIVKPNGSHNIYPSQYKGDPINVIELSYTVTPLSSGKITIPSLKITGVYTSRKSTGFSGLFDSIFENTKHNIVTNSKEFVVQSGELQLDVLPPAANITPWLPAQGLSLNEKIEQGELMVGKPIRRIITTTAKGLRANQLTPIDSELMRSEDYKIYAEMPEINDQVEKKIITSSRKDIYTIIPQKAGTITLPAINIKWWNVKESKLAVATLPARTLQIKASNIPNTTNEEPIGGNINAEEQEHQLVMPNGETSKTTNGLLLIILVATLGFGGVFVVGLLRNTVIARSALLRRGNPDTAMVQSLRNGKQTSLSKNSAKISDLNSASSVNELYEFLKNYAHYNLGMSKNSSLEMIFAAFEKNSPNIKKEHYKPLMTKIENVLYFGKDFDFKEIKKECATFLKLAKKGKKKKLGKKGSTLPKLNPVSKNEAF